MHDLGVREMETLEKHWFRLFRVVRLLVHIFVAKAVTFV